MSSIRFWLTLILLLAACSEATSDNDTPDAPASPTVAQPDTITAELVRNRGMLNCGVNDSLPGFGFQNEDGSFSGFDVDFCRALAAAVLGDAERVNFIPLNSQERFAAVQDGTVDVLIRNTTFTLTRDVIAQLEFGPILFYDGQGIMVDAESNIFELDDLTNRAVCVQPGTTTIENLRDTGIDLDIVEVESADVGFDSLLNGECDAYTADRTSLIAQQSLRDAADTLRILDVVLSQEPLAPAYRDGDDEWGNIIRWTIFGMVHAERFGITSANLDSFLNSGIPEIEVLLGEEGNLGAELALTNDFMQRVIEQVGNYGEIYARNVGDDSSIGLPRGLNALWTSGGLLYAPPFR